MKVAHALAGLATLAGAVCLNASPSYAVQYLVGLCPAKGHYPCAFGFEAPWKDTLSLAQLTALGLSTNVPLIVTQTHLIIIRLGVTTADFSTTTGPDIETLPEYHGPEDYTSFPPFPSGLLVGDFFIPDNATGLTISGTFGYLGEGNSAPSNVCLGPGGCNITSFAIPETSTWGMMLLGFAALGVAGYRASRRSLAVAGHRQGSGEV